MVGVGLVVERGDLAVAGGLVQGDRLAQGAVGFQLDGVRVAGCRAGLQFGEKTAAEPEPADGQRAMNVGGTFGTDGAYGTDSNVRRK